MKNIKTAALIIIIALLSSFTFSQNQEKTYQTNMAGLDFELEKVKPLGKELHFYFTIKASGKNSKLGFGNARSGKIATVIDNEGNKYYCDRMKLGNKNTTSYLDRIVIKDEPIKAVFIASDKDIAKLKLINKFYLPTEKKGTLAFSDIPLPYKNDSLPWNENTIEFQDRLYLKLKTAKIEEDNNKDVLRIYYSVLNKSDTTIKFLASGRSLKIIDNEDNSYTSYYIENNGKEDHYTAHYYFKKDTEFTGYFEFEKPENINNIKHFEFKPYSGSNTFKIPGLSIEQ